MRVARVITSAEYLRHSPRKFAQDSVKATRGGGPKTRRLTSPFLRPSNLKGCLCISTKRQRPIFRRSTDPDNQAVVNDEETASQPEEDSNDIAEEKQEDAAPATFTCPGAEILQKLSETGGEDVAAVLPELEETLTRLDKEKEAADARFAEIDAEQEESKRQYLRLNADFENFRKRSGSEQEKLRTSTKGDVIEALLPLIDNFEMARTQIKPQNESEEAIVGNFMGLYRQMVDLFSELGVESIDCDQKPFDPEYHDAIMRELNNDLPDGTVTAELRKGFTIKGRLLRPAMVKVSYSDDVLQDTELPMDDGGDVEATMEIETDIKDSNNSAEQSK